MFEQLRNRIHRQNMDMLRQQHRPQQEYSFHSSEEDPDLADRMATFSELMYQLPPAPHSRPQNGRRQRNQVELLEETMRLREEEHQREIEYLKEHHETELRALKLQVDRLQHERKKAIKDEGLRAQWLKDGQRLTQLQGQYERDTQQLHADKIAMKREILGLKMLLKQKEEQQLHVSQEEQLESATQTAMKEQNRRLKDELLGEQSRCQKLQKALQIRKRQCEEVTKELSQNRIAYDTNVDEHMERHKNEVLRVEEQNKQLRKRNQTLQSMFMEHLSQTSQSIQQGIRGAHEKSMRNTTLPLPDSPIRPRSKPKQDSVPDLDPQKAANCSCKCPNQRLKGKLAIANRKIVELLSQKCRRGGWSYSH